MAICTHAFSFRIYSESKNEHTIQNQLHIIVTELCLYWNQSRIHSIIDSGSILWNCQQSILDGIKMSKTDHDDCELILNWI